MWSFVALNSISDFSLILAWRHRPSLQSDGRSGASSSSRSGAGKGQFCRTGPAIVRLGPLVAGHPRAPCCRLRPDNLPNHPVLYEASGLLSYKANHCWCPPSGHHQRRREVVPFDLQASKGTVKQGLEGGPEWPGVGERVGWVGGDDEVTVVHGLEGACIKLLFNSSRCAPNGKTPVSILRWDIAGF